MINPKAELFKWGPIDGRHIYVDQFALGFLEFPDRLEGGWPEVIGHLHKDTVLYVIDYNDLRENGKFIFKKYIDNEKEQRKRYKTWQNTVKKLRLMEKTVNKGIKDLKLYNKWYNILIDFWMEGFIPELANLGAEQMLKEWIMKHHKDNFIEIFETLSAPEEYSFFQLEELRFLNTKLIKNKKKQLEELKKHQKRYYWLRNNYAFIKVLDLEFFKKELDKISIEEAKEKIKEIKNYLTEIKKKKKGIIKKYKINKKVIGLANKLAFCIWWQDYRKKFIFIANHILCNFLKAIEKEKKIPFKELHWYSLTEIKELINNNKKIDVSQRIIGFTTYYYEKEHKVEFIEGKKAYPLIKPYIEVKVRKLKKLKGLVVSKGKNLKGKVKILLSPKHINKMKKGDILVAAMTSPDFIVAMRKASAIITDEGGMTCHAAIVSRELKIPCIVATKIATKVLKDGDIIEVNADKGVVRKL